jgi:hypothetical protein
VDDGAAQTTTANGGGDFSINIPLGTGDHTINVTGAGKELDLEAAVRQSESEQDMEFQSRAASNVTFLIDGAPVQSHQGQPTPGHLWKKKIHVPAGHHVITARWHQH